MRALQDEHKALTEVQENQRLKSIDTNARDAWVKVLNEVQEKGEAQELVWNPNNSSHNAKVVQPLRAAAAKEFGTLVTRLAKNGLKTLDADDAYALARSCLYGGGSNGTGTLGERESSTPRAAETPAKEGANLLKDLNLLAR
jgi:hypothetical protein